MMKLTLVYVVLLLWGCSHSQVSTDSEKKEITATFQFRSLAGIEMDIPRTELSILLDSSITVLDTLPVCTQIAKSDFHQYEIPDSNVLDACGGWYAGSGDYYYIQKADNSILIYHGWQDEMQEDDGFHYSLMKSIKLCN